jgi:hypothetical protein
VGRKTEGSSNSERAKLGVNDSQRADKALKGISGKRLTYRRIGNSAQA